MNLYNLSHKACFWWRYWKLEIILRFCSWLPQLANPKLFFHHKKPPNQVVWFGAWLSTVIFNWHLLARIHIWDVEVLEKPYMLGSKETLSFRYGWLMRDKKPREPCQVSRTCNVAVAEGVAPQKAIWQRNRYPTLWFTEINLPCSRVNEAKL